MFAEVIGIPGVVWTYGDFDPFIGEDEGSVCSG